MAGSLNRAELIGFLGQDPETRFMPNGNQVTTISVATSKRWKDKTSGDQREHTEWHRCVAYDKLAEIIGKYLAKGSYVRVSGELRTRKWQDKTGADRYSTEIVLSDMLMLDRRSDGDSDKSADKPREFAHSVPPPVSDMDDDIPF